MNAVAKTIRPEQVHKRKDKKLVVRVESSLDRRLRLAAEQSDITPSDKVRRILDAALPPAL